MAFSTGFQSKQCQQITQINMSKSVFIQLSTRLFIDKRLCVKIGCRRESWAYYIIQTVESSPGLLSFILILLCDWSRKPAPSSQPIRCKTKDNPGLAIRFFPRFKQFLWFHSKFSLANDNVDLWLVTGIILALVFWPSLQTALKPIIANLHQKSFFCLQNQGNEMFNQLRWRSRN